MLDSSGRHFPAAEASANKGSARTGTDVCERRWWNSPGCGCAGNPTAPCRLGSRGRVGKAGGRIKKIMIVALARKLLIDLWRYAKDGVIPEGAKMKMA